MCFSFAGPSSGVCQSRRCRSNCVAGRMACKLRRHRRARNGGRKRRATSRGSRHLRLSAQGFVEHEAVTARGGRLAGHWALRSPSRTDTHSKHHGGCGCRSWIPAKSHAGNGCSRCRAWLAVKVPFDISPQTASRPHCRRRGTAGRAMVCSITGNMPAQLVGTGMSSTVARGQLSRHTTR
jgi:hypothetical protein